MQFNNVFFIFSLIAGAFLVTTEACKGCVNLDEYNFEKVIPRFEAVLVKFDVAYPYGDKHEVFNNLASEILDNKNFILAQVAIKDYGDKENEDFSKKYGVNSKEDLPALRLFVQGEDEPFAFDKNMPWNNENIKTFIRDHSNIYIGLPGCLEQFDKLANKFVTSVDGEKVIKEAESAAKKLELEREKEIAKMYIKFMKRVKETGVSFISQESRRLRKIITDGKINDKKRRELSSRLNILKAFNLENQKIEL